MMWHLTLLGSGMADVSAVQVLDLEAYGAFEFVERVPSIAVCAASDGAGARCDPTVTSSDDDEDEFHVTRPIHAICCGGSSSCAEHQEGERKKRVQRKIHTPRKVSGYIYRAYVYVYCSEVHSSLA